MEGKNADEALKDIGIEIMGEFNTCPKEVN
jgi:hypothetical protein